MQSVSNIRILLIGFLLLFFGHIWANAKEVARCAVCGMDVKPESRSSFEYQDGDKSQKLCSFSCAAKLHERKPKLQIKAKDYLSLMSVPADNAYYLIRSKKIEESEGFSMPPVVAAFQSLQSAEKIQKDLGEGEIAHGLEAVCHKFQ